MKDDVLLVVPPFSPMTSPSMGVSLLKAILAARGIGCDVRYPSLRFLDWFEGDGQTILDHHRTIARSDPFFSAPWIFARDLWGDRLTTDDRTASAIESFYDDQGRPEIAGQIFGLRSTVGSFLDACLEEIAFERYRIIGFTSMFFQHVAGLALARRVRARCPEATIVFGGANCDGPMGLELARLFPMIDLVFQGEADHVFPDTVEEILAGRPVSPKLGLVARGPDGVCRSGGQYRLADDLDALPDPDFDDYFEAWRATPVADDAHPQLLIETSRGCWWGAKHHCKFCGLRAVGMAFRAKSPDRVEAELERLSTRYRTTEFSVVDNIVPTEYFRELFPRLARHGRYRLFYEIKANLTDEQFALLRAAGVTWIQPGIESLSSPILRLMSKGVSALQNIQTLRLGAIHDVRITWIHLFGFPGEDPAEYETILERIGLLTHLEPPVVADIIDLDRFSPYFERADEFPIENIRPFESYQHVWPIEPEELHRLAYHFRFDHRDGRDPWSYGIRIHRAVEAWKAREGVDRLEYHEGQELLWIADRRQATGGADVLLSGHQRDVYLAATRVRSRATLERLEPTDPADRMLAFLFGSVEGRSDDGSIEAETAGIDVIRPAPIDGDVGRFLDELIGLGLMIEDEGQILALALPAARPAVAAAPRRSTFGL